MSTSSVVSVRSQKEISDRALDIHAQIAKYGAPVGNYLYPAFMAIHKPGTIPDPRFPCHWIDKKGFLVWRMVSTFNYRVQLSPHNLLYECTSLISNAWMTPLEGRYYQKTAKIDIPDCTPGYEESEILSARRAQWAAEALKLAQASAVAVVGADGDA